MPPRFALGLDYGTTSVRALVVSIEDGREIGTALAPYPHGRDGVLTDPADPHLARQHPEDYRASLERAVTEALAKAREDEEFAPERIIGIGVDATASTPLPVDERLVPLASHPDLASRPEAWAWLWKDHTAHAEAEEITALLRRESPEHLDRLGGTCSSEWFFPKLLRCARIAPDVLARAAAWVELGDWVTASLTGATDARELPRNACAAGHKALWHETLGVPNVELWKRLSPLLATWLADKPFPAPSPPAQRVGVLCERWASRLGLPAGIAVAAAGIDAHVGAVGAGVAPAVLVKVIGTSSCDMLVHPAERGDPPRIPGISGVVRDSILPGHWGIEAGQAAVGDIFGWFVREFTAPAGIGHDELASRARALAPAETGLLALDWHNGNRCLLADPRLTGLLIGQTLETKAHEVYRALIEGTAFGARLIIDRLEEHGVAVEEVVCCGGIAEKNPLLLQIYADVLGRPLALSRSKQTCALGAAMLGAVAAGPAVGGPTDICEAQQRMTGRKPHVHRPRPETSAAYARLFELYRTLHDAFARGNGRIDLSGVMKELLDLQARARRAPRVS